MTDTKPYISLCLIVKNEGPSLKRCLQSFSGAYNELIVVDTGSEDETVEIAREFGARIDFLPWQDDFSAARNHACSLANSEWVVMVDGDEALAPGGTAQRLPGILRQVPPRVDKLLIEQRTMLKDETVSLFVDRIFRQAAGLFWKYRIHEVLETPPERTAMTHDFYLLHDNSLKRRADSRIPPEREAMYLRALTLDMKDYPEDPRPAFYYAATLLGAGRPREAMEAYEHYFRLSENREAARRAVAFRDAATVAGQLGNPIQRRTLLFRSLEHDWRSVHTYLALADLAAENNNPDETLHWLTVATRCVPGPSDLYWTASTSLPVIFRRLADTYRLKGEEKAARRCEREAEAAKKAEWGRLSHPRGMPKAGRPTQKRKKRSP